MTIAQTKAARRNIMHDRRFKRKRNPETKRARRARAMLKAMRVHRSYGYQKR